MPPTINDLINQAISPTAFAQESPLAEEARKRFEFQTLPLIENQFALQGLAGSPAMNDAVMQGLATALPQFIQGDIQNQRAGQQIASNLLLGQEQLGLGQRQLDVEQELGLGQLGLGGRQLGQSAAVSSANIANQQQQRQLQAALGAGNLLSQFAGGVTLPAAQQQFESAQAALSGLINTGQQQQQTEQQRFAAANAERARLQALSQQGAFGATGGAGLTPLLGQTSSGK